MITLPLEAFWWLLSLAFQLGLLVCGVMAWLAKR